MKQTLIAFLAVAVLASCNQKNEDKGDGAATSTEFANPQDGTIPSYEHISIPEDTGNAWIQNYHHYLVNTLGIPRPELKSENLSFMIDADRLREYLNAHTTYKMLDVYLAQKSSDGKMTLVYVGAKDSIVNKPDGTKDTFYVEEPHFLQVDTNQTNPMLLDNIRPCPTCADRTSVHQIDQ